MLTKKQLQEIREHLENAKNPIFYFDNDADGLCSYILLRKFLGRGKGVAVRSFPGLDVGYARKALELGADYVFVLDKPVLSREFVESIDRFGLPLVWIDHHDVFREEFEKEFKNIFVYNPARNSGKDKAKSQLLICVITLRR
jgi:single-stranded DNA-specific DHH superfamily exonuclease